MRHNYKGFKENPLILTEKKIYEHQNTKKINKSYEIHGPGRGHPRWGVVCPRPGVLYNRL